MEQARQWVTESSRLGCLLGYDGSLTCSEPLPRAPHWYGSRSTWVTAEDAFTWDLAPAEPGDERLTRFGSAAILGPDGMVWSALVLDR